MGVICFKQNCCANMEKGANHEAQQISDLRARKVKGAGSKGSEWGHQCENDQARPRDPLVKAGADEQCDQRKGGREFVQDDPDEQLLPALLMLMVVGVEVFKIA